MDYKVLYRKYRPQDFNGIIGQKYITSILKNEIKNDKISHAYIFSGPRGTGKTSTAKVFAKAVNCLNKTEVGPCNKCENCLHFKENADIIEIDAASNNGVEEIREIINNIKLAPAYSKYKVYIIDEVHMLSNSAFNALLLTLEEPPKHVIFILATTNVEAVPITILSRCQRFDFQKISIDDIKNRLSYVVNEEKIKITEEALEEIAYISDGGMRDALSILDQLSSNKEEITVEEVTAHFGLASKKQINDIFDTIKENNTENFHQIIKEFQKLNVDYKNLIKKFLEKIEKEAIKAKTDSKYNGLDYKDLKNMAFELASISNYVNITINPYLLIEITLLQYFNNPNKNANNKKVLKETREEITSKNEIQENNNEIQKEEQKPDKIVIKEDSKAIAYLTKIRINNCFCNAQKRYLLEAKEIWPVFITKLENKSLVNILIDINIVVASDKIIILCGKSDGTINLINENLIEIEKEFKKITNKNYNFIAINESKWNEEKQNYIQNIKNGVKYSYIKEEPTENIEEKQEEKSSIEEVALNLFDKDKIELE